ncbi:MAG: hypothetical protein IAF38_21995 [Bacteroidia bacterium]|nr:hypothetical protein [Bacteroidia bacterium]
MKLKQKEIGTKNSGFFRKKMEIPSKSGDGFKILNINTIKMYFPTTNDNKRMLNESKRLTTGLGLRFATPLHHQIFEALQILRKNKN